VAQVGNRHLTAREFVLGGIRDAMLDGRIMAGQILDVDELAHSFGVSRTPVREALEILEIEGFLVHGRRFSQPLVTPLSADRVQEAYMMRIALESIAAAQACKVIDAAGIAALERCARNGRAALSRDDIQGWSEYNREFHTRLSAWSKLPLLSRSVASLIDLSSFYSRMFWNDIGSVLNRATGEHETIVDACREHNAALAKRLIQSHLRASCVAQVALARRHEAAQRDTLQKRRSRDD